MSEQPKSHRSTGMEYSYFILRTMLGMLFYYIWIASVHTFSKTGLELFWELFIIMFFSGIIARVCTYLILYFLSKKAKGALPGFYQLNFQRSINRLSIVSIVGILLCCFIYAFGINELISRYFFSDQGQLISIVGSYLFIKIGTLAIAWVFLKTRNV